MVNRNSAAGNKKITIFISTTLNRNCLAVPKILSVKIFCLSPLDLVTKLPTQLTNAGIVIVASTIFSPVF
ncbi:MAG: hypothetical protein AVDCRST_MAG96-3078, partial [uncultured Segetibacter sp.]